MSQYSDADGAKRSVLHQTFGSIFALPFTEILRRLFTYGPLWAVGNLWARTKKAIAFHLSTRWDRAHGVQTQGEIMPGDLEIESANRRFGHEYMVFPPRTFARILNSLDRDFSNYTFVDIGSGKGRVLLLASQFNFRNIIGVEYAADLHAIAKSNIARFDAGQVFAPEQVRCRTIEAHHADALNFELPKNDCFIFLYSPFKWPLLEDFLTKIEASYRANPRHIIVCFTESKGWDLPALVFANHSLFTPLPTIRLPRDWAVKPMVDYVVYETRRPE